MFTFTQVSMTLLPPENYGFVLCSRLSWCSQIFCSPLQFLRIRQSPLVGSASCCVPKCSGWGPFRRHTDDTNKWPNCLSGEKSSVCLWTTSSNIFSFVFCFKLIPDISTQQCGSAATKRGSTVTTGVWHCTDESIICVGNEVGGGLV